MPQKVRRFGGSESGVILVFALMMLTLLSVLGATLLTMSVTENTLSHNAMWSEGALSAAEAGVNRGINQLSANAQTSIAAVPATTIAGDYSFRSGRRTDTTPQPLQFTGSRIESGFSEAVGTGYNPGGFAFHTYQVNATGAGPRFAQREVEIRAEYGPVAQ